MHAISSTTLYLIYYLFVIPFYVREITPSTSLFIINNLQNQKHYYFIIAKCMSHWHYNPTTYNLFLESLNRIISMILHSKYMPFFLFTSTSPIISKIFKYVGAINNISVQRTFDCLLIIKLNDVINNTSITSTS